MVIAMADIALAVVFGAASWTIATKKPSARGWGIAASIGYLLMSAPILFGDR